MTKLRTKQVDLMIILWAILGIFLTSVGISGIIDIYNFNEMYNKPLLIFPIGYTVFGSIILGAALNKISTVMRGKNGKS